VVGALADAGRTSEARGWADRAAELSATLDTSFAEAASRHASGIASSDVETLRDAAARWDHLGSPVLAARALEWAGALATRGELDDLTGAASRYAALPAPALAERVRAVLRQRGPAGRRAAQRVGELTPREREVAALARRGLPTRRIAERLHLSERTVESHLARIYAKLGVSGRAEMGRAPE
jgi:DNA-binding CsgD family transcriptional regulator